jgi:hypothetical protein
MTVRDLAVVAGCLLLEPRSLPAFWQVAKCWPAAWERRREIMRRRRVTDRALVRWFRFELAGEPLTGEVVAETAPRTMLAPDAA